MRFAGPIACGALGLTLISCSGKPAATPREADDQRAIADLVASENAGFTSANINQLLTLYADDVVMMPPGEPAIRGKENVRAWLEKLLSQTRIGSSTVSDDLKINGDWAVERLALHVTMTPAAGGEAIVDAGKIVHVYRRQSDGKWKIAQDIWSSDAPPNAAHTPVTPATPAATEAAPAGATPATPPPASGTAAPAATPAPGAAPADVRRIANMQAVADLIQYHQDAIAGSAFRTRGIIARWDLPVRIYVDATVNADNVQRAMAEWQLRAGISYSFITKDQEPRILVRAGLDGLIGGAAARGGVDATDPNNRARSGLVVIKPELANCDISEANCSSMFGRVMGNAIGLFGQVPGGITASAFQPSQREIDMLRTLYQLPHGAQIKPDGTWTVVK